jgi:hypothetical protein
MFAAIIVVGLLFIKLSLLIVSSRTVTVYTLRIRAAITPILETTALAGDIPQSIKLNVAQWWVTVISRAAPTFSPQKKPAAKVESFHPFNQLLFNT